MSAPPLDRPIEVLLIEDRPHDAELIRAQLREIEGIAFQVSSANRLAAGLAFLSGRSADVILIDLAPPVSIRDQSFRTVHAQAPNVPIIIIIGPSDESLALGMIKEGAQDYLVKGDFSGTHLARSIRNAIERQRIREKIAVDARDRNRPAEQEGG